MCWPSHRWPKGPCTTRLPDTQAESAPAQGSISSTSRRLSALARSRVAMAELRVCRHQLAQLVGGIKTSVLSSLKKYRNRTGTGTRPLCLVPVPVPEGSLPQHKGNGTGTGTGPLTMPYSRTAPQATNAHPHGSPHAHAMSNDLSYLIVSYLIFST